MALLKTSFGLLGLSFCGASIVACSVIVDVESLHAERVDAMGDSAIEDLSSPQDTAETSPPNDTEVVTPDGTTAQDGADTAEVADVGPTEELRFTHTGALGCVLDYYLTPVTNCPQTCAWEFSFDATGSVGINTFGWHFSVTGGYVLAGDSATGPTPKLTINTPGCGLFGSGDVGPAKLLVEASTNGSPLEIVKTIDFSVRLVTSCPASPRPNCLTP